MINNSITLQKSLFNFLTFYGDPEIVLFSKINLSEIEKQKYDLIVLSGSAYKNLVGNEKLYKKEIELIRKTTIPIIGICFGFEVIAEVFGEKLTKEKYIDSGLRKINFRHQNYSVWHNHYFALEKLNKNSKLQPLSYSQEGIQIYKVKDKNIFGLQFHPEHTEHKNDGSEIFQRILEKI